MPAGGGARHSPRPRRRLALPIGELPSPEPQRYSDSNAARETGVDEDLIKRPLEVERIGEVTLKGFSESTEVFVARQSREDGK